MLKVRLAMAYQVLHASEIYCNHQCHSQRHATIRFSLCWCWQLNHETCILTDPVNPPPTVLLVLIPHKQSNLCRPIPSTNHPDAQMETCWSATKVAQIRAGPLSCWMASVELELQSLGAAVVDSNHFCRFARLCSRKLCWDFCWLLVAVSMLSLTRPVCYCVCHPKLCWCLKRRKDQHQSLVLGPVLESLFSGRQLLWILFRTNCCSSVLQRLKHAGSVP